MARHSGSIWYDAGLTKKGKNNTARGSAENLSNVDLLKTFIFPSSAQHIGGLEITPECQCLLLIQKQTRFLAVSIFMAYQSSFIFT